MKFIQVESFFDFLHCTINIVWCMFVQWLFLVTAILVQMTGYLITYRLSPTPSIGLKHMCMNGNCSLILRKFCEFFYQDSFSLLLNSLYMCKYILPINVIKFFFFIINKLKMYMTNIFLWNLFILFFLLNC